MLPILRDSHIQDSASKLKSPMLQSRKINESLMAFTHGKNFSGAGSRILSKIDPSRCRTANMSGKRGSFKSTGNIGNLLHSKDRLDFGKRLVQGNPGRLDKNKQIVSKIINSSSYTTGNHAETKEMECVNKKKPQAALFMIRRTTNKGTLLKKINWTEPRLGLKT